ncbi:unnamed protein product [Rhizophagus irregularis]|nr:unnamed protein product [Rhizophagus irregularis]
MDDKYKMTYNHVIALNTNKTQTSDINTQCQNTRFQQPRTQYHTSHSPNNNFQRPSYNTPSNQQKQNLTRPQDHNNNNNYANLYEEIKQLKNQIHTLTNKISLLEHSPKQYEKKFSHIESQIDNINTNINIVNTKQDKYDKILQKLTENISKLSDAKYTNEKPFKQTKRSSPYDKISYEQAKKKHYIRSSSKTTSPKASADDSDNFPHTEDGAIMQHDLTELTDNAANDGIIKPDSDYTQNEDASGPSSYGYNIFNFGSHK